MSKRARYDGPNPVYVIPDEGDLSRSVEPILVEPGHLLPADVPAKVRDDLLRSADWTEVADPSGSGKTTSDKKGDE